MVVTIDCRDTIHCTVTIVLCNRAQVYDPWDYSPPGPLPASKTTHQDQYLHYMVGNCPGGELSGYGQNQILFKKWVRGHFIHLTGKHLCKLMDSNHNQEKIKVALRKFC